MNAGFIVKRSKHTMFAAMLCLALLAPRASAQSSDSKTEAQGNVIRVGIPIMANTSNGSVSRKLMRDSLVRDFQPDKKKKKGKQADTRQVEAVPLDSDSPGDAAREARDKNCDYILYTKLVELRAPGEPRQPNQPGSISIGRDPLSASPDPTMSHEPVHYAVVEYRLQRLGEPEARVDSSVSGQEHSDENGTVQRLLFMIVNRVKGELREPSANSR